jgi:HK97 gp10 family phage protein
VGRVVVKYNKIPAVKAAMVKALGDAMDESVDTLDSTLNERVWRDTGILAGTIQDRDPSRLHALISVGLNKGHGFYSRFLEWGTSKMSAQPVVGPTAHQFEPKMVSIFTKYIKRAAGAG